MPRSLILLLALTGIAVLLAATGCWPEERPRTASATQPLPDQIPFTAGGLIAASDVDQWATAYGDRQLRPLPGATDTLSVLSLPSPVENPRVAAVPASNSVVGWPQTVDVSPDGRYAYVADTRGAPPKHWTAVPNSVYEDLPQGGTLTTVRLTPHPRVVDVRKVGRNLGSVAVRRDGHYLAIASEEPGAEIVLVAVHNGVPDARYPFAAAVDFGDVARPGIRSLAWHPDGHVLAASVSDRQVQFWAVDYDQQGRPTGIRPLGTPVRVGETLTVGAFHPAGHYFVIADVGWGANASPKDYLFNDAGQIVVIAFDARGHHRISDRIQVGRSPEGWAMSPDGSRLVAVNMNRTYLPDSIPARWFPGRDTASLSLIAFDAERGQGQVLDEAHFEGLLPEDAVFDADGDAIAVAIFHLRGGDQGLVEFWTVTDDRLQRSGYRLPVARGAHDLLRLP